MRSPGADACPFEDAVVARYLDGDVEQPAPGDPPNPSEGDARPRGGGWREHLQHCQTCRSSLARSRHLDACLATAATHPGDRTTADRLLRNALAAAVRQAPTPAPRRMAKSRVTCAAAAGFALGLLAMRWLHDREAAPPRGAAAAGNLAVAERDVAERDVDTRHRRANGGTDGSVGEGPADGGVPPVQVSRLTAAGASPSSAMQLAAPRIETPRRSPWLDDPALPKAVALQARARAIALGWPQPTHADLAATVASAQLGAGRALLDSPQPTSLPLLARAIARDDGVARKLVDALAAHRPARLRLRSALHERCDADLCELAVRLGDAELDRRVMTHCLRDTALADRVARACARPARDVARVGFLLELWAAVTRGGDDGTAPPRDDLALAAAWFAPLPSNGTRELLEHLHTTRSAEVRHRVFLALGARADTTALGSLLAWTESPNAIAAASAAYAMGCYPAACGPRLEEAARTSRRPELLWAALASQGNQRIRARLLAAGLPRDEADLVTSSHLRPEQIVAAAALLRGRNLVPKSNP